MGKLTVIETNHSYKLEKIGKEVVWISQEQEVEVLTVHFEKGRMRVRGKKNWDDDGEKTYTWDCSNKSFLEKYKIVER